MKLKWWKKSEATTAETLVNHLTKFKEHCDHRIELGDPDIDDWIFRGRDYAQELIIILTLINAVTSEEEDDE